MLEYPIPTTREEKLEIANEIKNRLLARFKKSILAIGIYGSIGQGTEGPYSDIEIHVITDNQTVMENHEFIYDKFKIEISAKTKDEIYKKARTVDNMWPIQAGVFIHTLPLYDPSQLFEQIKLLPLEITEKEVKDIMREFMVWEPYETMAKIRNNWQNGNHTYLSIGARDLAWQTAKLIGLANKKYYSTRARIFEESLRMEIRPEGYEELVSCVMEGNPTDREEIYTLCEDVWTSLNKWFEELDINYKVNELPV